MAVTGVKASNAQNQFVATDVVRDQVRASINAVSGVNLDEEAANLLKFQQAYEAAAQLMRVSDELFSSLLRAVS